MYIADTTPIQRQYYKQHKKPNRNRTFNVTLILLS